MLREELSLSIEWMRGQVSGVGVKVSVSGVNVPSLCLLCLFLIGFSFPLSLPSFVQRYAIGSCHLKASLQ